LKLLLVRGGGLHAIPLLLLLRGGKILTRGGTRGTGGTDASTWIVGPGDLVPAAVAAGPIIITVLSGDDIAVDVDVTAASRAAASADGGGVARVGIVNRAAAERGGIAGVGIADGHLAACADGAGAIVVTHGASARGVVSGVNILHRAALADDAGASAGIISAT